MRRLALGCCAVGVLYVAHSTLLTTTLAPEILRETIYLDVPESPSENTVPGGTEDPDANRPHCFQWGTSSSRPPDNGLCALSKAECDAWQVLFAPEFSDTHECDLYHAAMFCVSLKLKSSQEQTSKSKTLCAMSARRCKYVVDRLRSNQYWEPGTCVKYTDEQRP